MLKKIILAILIIILLVGAIAGIKALQIKKMIDQGAAMVMPPETVSATESQVVSWEAVTSAVGSLDAIQGLMVTAERPGKIVNIAFEAGSVVQAGALLVQQDVSIEKSQLRAAEAAEALAKINRERSARLVAQKTIPQSDLDAADARYKEASAQTEEIRTVIAQKTIRAPFAGRLGIRQINLGQYLDIGTAIVSLQAMDPIYVNFSLPQQMANIKSGSPIRISADIAPDQVIEGQITAISPEVDSSSRNIRMQGTLANPNEDLRPGMFVNVTVVLPDSQSQLAVPATAVLYAPYGDSVFVIEESKGENGESGKKIRQQLVRIGEKRGDYVAILTGLKQGETVVSTGVFKLRNGMAVVVDNSVAPEFNVNPSPDDK